MRTALRQVTVAAFALITAACAASTSSRPSGDPNLIRRDQVLTGNYRNAYDAVAALHPNWLVKRSASNSRNTNPIWVYVDNSKYGDVSWLKNVAATNIGSIRRIDAGSATTRWGTGHSEGVIQVTTYIPN